MTDTRNYRNEKRVTWNSNQPIYPRQVWKARPPKRRKYIEKPATAVFHSYTGTEPCFDVETCSNIIYELQYDDMEIATPFQGLPDIQYNFLIGGDGRVYAGRGWRIWPTLISKWSNFTKKAYLIGYIGTYGDDIKPSPPMFKAQETIITYGVYNKYIAPKFLEFTISTH